MEDKIFTSDELALTKDNCPRIDKDILRKFADNITIEAIGRYPQFPGSMSVTEVIKASGLITGEQFIDDWYLGRGQSTHAATAIYDRGEIDKFDIAPETVGFLESWKHYREFQNYSPTHIELSLNDPIYSLCGTIDRLPLLDIKGPNKSKWHVLQLAGYWHLCRVNGLKMYCNTPHTVHLDPDGGMAKVHTYTLKQMREAEKDLLILLAAIRIKQNYGG